SVCLPLGGGRTADRPFGLCGRLQQSVRTPTAGAPAASAERQDHAGILAFVRSRYPGANLSHGDRRLRTGPALTASLWGADLIGGGTSCGRTVAQPRTLARLCGWIFWLLD